MDFWLLQKFGSSTGHYTAAVSNKPNESTNNLLLTNSGYILADGGFDVWIMNFRGGYYSRGHKTLDPDNDAAYWNFNIEELGRYDVAAALEYLLNKTGHESSYLMGHSMGGTAGLILLSTRPEYNKKVKLFVNLATMAFVNHKLNPLFELGFNVLLPAAAVSYD